MIVYYKCKAHEKSVMCKNINLHNMVGHLYILFNVTKNLLYIVCVACVPYKNSTNIHVGITNMNDHYLTIDPFPVTRGRTLHRRQDERVIMRYVKIRSHHIVVPKDDTNNPTKNEEVADRESTEICVICLGEYKHEETIGTFCCRHEYHVGCIKKWLLRKKDCPLCRASVLHFT